MRKVVFVIDGWFMRKRIYTLKSFFYNGPNIRKYCLKHLRPGDILYRIFYYDTKPLTLQGHNPITNKAINFAKTQVAEQQAALLETLKETPNFALRLGETVWRDKAWIVHPQKLKALLKKKITVDDLKETDVYPVFEQKTVDMKIGLDIAYMAEKKVADLLIIITGDSDIVPALKFARREGMQVGLDPLLSHVRPILKEHVDFMGSKLQEPKSIQGQCRRADDSP